MLHLLEKSLLRVSEIAIVSPSGRVAVRVIPVQWHKSLGCHDAWIFIEYEALDLNGFLFQFFLIAN
jgi:hypothetical protein